MPQVKKAKRTETVTREERGTRALESIARALHVMAVQWQEENERQECLYALIDQLAPLVTAELFRGAASKAGRTV